MQVEESKQAATQTTSAVENAATEIRGRGIFVVETTAAGVAVHTAFATEDQRVLQAPAVFPDLQYALTQVDQLRELVIAHFSRAARVGAQVIAGQSQSSGDTERLVS